MGEIAVVGTSCSNAVLAYPVLDNLGAIYISINPVFHSRMKHLAIDYHFVRDLFQSFELRVVHVSVDDQLAQPRLFSLCNKIGVISSTPS